MAGVQREVERDVVMALKMKAFASDVHMENIMERIRRYLEVELQKPVELAGYAYTAGSGTSLVSHRGTETLADLVKHA